MEVEILKYVAEAGVATVAVIVVFLFYRSDSLKRDQAWQKHCEEATVLWKAIMDDKRGLILADQQTREAHIKALTELTDYLKIVNGKAAELRALALEREEAKYGRRREDYPGP